MIIKSAVWHEGHLLTGHRHHDCIAIAAILVRAGVGKFPVNGIQGFLTDDGRFLNREDAAIYALKIGQIKELKFSKRDLFSEDLW